MLTLTKIALIAGVVYPVGTAESDIEGMTDGERQSLVSTGGLSEPQSEPMGVSPGSDPVESTDYPSLASFGVPKKLVDIMAANDPPLITKGDVLAYLVDHDDLVPVNGIGAKSSEVILSLLGIK